MAKKQKSFSHINAQNALEALTEATADNFGLSLLRIFAGYGDGQISRVIDGRGNLAKDGHSILIKGLMAYQPCAKSDNTEALHLAIEQMQEDKRIVKKAAPRLYVASDGISVVAYDPKIKDFYENTIALMWRDFEFFKPLAGIEKIEYVGEAEADVKSAEIMAKIFDEIRRHNDINDNETLHCINIFMSRLLFCFFAEDTGLFPAENLFTNSIKQWTKTDGSDLGQFISDAFLAMSTDDETERYSLSDIIRKFPYVNGGLFKDRLPIPHLSRRARALIINCGDYDWADINPDIFGSMIQAVITPEMRSGLGMHYTSVPNIMKVIQPLFLDSLTDEFNAAVATKDRKRLQRLLARLGHIKFFDPACGSGNFLIIAYKRIRQLEINIYAALAKITDQVQIPVSTISLQQFYGIEIDEYARDTAVLSLWLAEHQMNMLFDRMFGTKPDALPLHPSGHIVCGNACRIDWNIVCPHTPDDEVYVMGNPPYLGSKLQDAEQKQDAAIALAELKDKKGLDYIANWFWLGAKYVKGTKARAAFVSTNSISQGEQVAMLWRPILESGIIIDFARTSFKWSNNAKNNAAITCAIIGLVDKQFATDAHKLYIEHEGTCKIVNAINPYLSAGESFIVEKTDAIPQGLPKAEFGSMPRDGGFLIMNPDEADELLRQYPNAQEFVKTYMGSQELLQGFKRYCLWIDDSPAAVNLAYSIPPINQRLQAVKKARSESKAESTSKYADRPYMFVQRAHTPLPAILIPAVSSERRQYIPIGFVDSDTVISNSAFALHGAELWMFALLTSRMHNAWVRAVGGSLETRIRYSATLCYNTFPFPKPGAVEKNELAALAQDILDIRDRHFDMTLGDMYNPETMPEDLLQAHRRLDAAVERLYRPEPFASDEDRLELLFKLYAKKTKK